jgi:hypothetical protein
MEFDRPADVSRLAERFPCDRVYARLHWAFMGIIAAAGFYGFVVARFVDTPRTMGVRFIAVILLSFNVLWWTVADRRFARYLCNEGWSRRLRLAALFFSLLLNVPIAYMFFSGRVPSFLGTPTWYAAAVTLWQLCLAVLLPMVALARLTGRSAFWAWRRLTRSSRGDCESSPAAACGGSVALAMDCGGADADPAFNSSRRAFLHTAFATVPAVMLGGMTVASRLQEGQIEVNRHAVAAPWLPDRLRGLTITQLSDLHVGRHYRPGLLPQLVETANSLRSDIVVVTGDIVDNSNEMLPEAVEALKQLEYRHGLFLCIGNHDELDSRPDFIRYVRGRLPLLLNERRCIEIGGERITIAGLDYANTEAPSGRRPGSIADVAHTLLGHVAREEGPVIALAHHPHAWDWLAEAGVPLTLSGHTHGGQIMLTPPDERPDIGAGRLLFRYIRGFYRAAGRTLFVNRGVGNWFPLRVWAPAEVVQIQLV